MDQEKVYLIVEGRPETKLEKFANRANTVLLVGTVVVCLAPVVYSGIEWIKWKRKIRKGLKDGSIVEIDGNYYETVIEKSND